MNNVFSRIVSLLGFRQMGGLFDEAQYFIADATGDVFMRSRAGQIFLRTVEPDGIYTQARSSQARIVGNGSEGCRVIAARSQRRKPFSPPMVGKPLSVLHHLKVRLKAR